MRISIERSEDKSVLPPWAQIRRSAARAGTGAAIDAGPPCAGATGIREIDDFCAPRGFRVSKRRQPIVAEEHLVATTARSGHSRREGGRDGVPPMAIPMHVTPRAGDCPLSSGRPRARIWVKALACSCPPTIASVPRRVRNLALPSADLARAIGQTFAWLCQHGRAHPDAVINGEGGVCIRDWAPALLGAYYFSRRKPTHDEVPLDTYI